MGQAERKNGDHVDNRIGVKLDWADFSDAARDLTSADAYRPISVKDTAENANRELVSKNLLLHDVQIVEEHCPTPEPSSKRIDDLINSDGYVDFMRASAGFDASYRQGWILQYVDKDRIDENLKRSDLTGDQRKGLEFMKQNYDQLKDKDGYIYKTGLQPIWKGKQERLFEPPHPYCAEQAGDLSKTHIDDLARAQYDFESQQPAQGVDTFKPGQGGIAVWRQYANAAMGFNASYKQGWTSQYLDKDRIDEYLQRTNLVYLQRKGLEFMKQNYDELKDEDGYIYRSSLLSWREKQE